MKSLVASHLWESLLGLLLGGGLAASEGPLFIVAKPKDGADGRVCTHVNLSDQDLKEEENNIYFQEQKELLPKEYPLR